MREQHLLGIAGTESGSGKTLITMGFIRAFRRAGYEVQPFKVGPDFIDPLYHESVADRPSINLDRFFLDGETLMTALDDYLGGAGLGLIEGVMGLYDGKSGRPGQYSTAELYCSLDVPYVLVVNAAGQSHSVAAKIKGFLEYDDRLDCLGVVLTRVGSERHDKMLRRAIGDNLSVPILGTIRDRESLSMPSRHLGLDTAFLFDNSETLKDSIDETITANLTLPDDFEPAETTEGQRPGPIFMSASDSRATIGVAWDDAFHFYYDYNLRQLKQSGARLEKVSPLNDESVPRDLDGLYLGGGYPEQFASELSANRTFIASLRDRLSDGFPTLAECGGFMYLSQTLTDRSGETYEMIGWFRTQVQQRSSFQALGYTSGRATENHPFLETGRTLRGHEFHYSDCTVPEKKTPAVRLREGTGLADGLSGLIRENTFGSYVHWHFGAVPELAENFVKRCAERRASYA